MSYMIFDVIYMISYKISYISHMMSYMIFDGCFPFYYFDIVKQVHATRF